MSLYKGLTITLKLITIILFVSSLFFDAYTGHEGFIVLALGALSFFGSPQLIAFFAWLANIFLFASFFVSKFSSLKLTLAIIAVFLGCLGYFVDELYTNEGGDTRNVKVAEGYFLWMSSIICNCILQFILIQKDDVIVYLSKFRKEVF